MLEVKPAAPSKDTGPLSPEQIAIGQNLQRYYQLHSVGPTPTRLQMLLDELMRRSQAAARPD
jgi:hypothetical protein